MKDFQKKMDFTPAKQAEHPMRHRFTTKRRELNNKKNIAKKAVQKKPIGKRCQLT